MVPSARFELAKTLGLGQLAVPIYISHEGINKGGKLLVLNRKQVVAPLVFETRPWTAKVNFPNLKGPFLGLTQMDCLYSRHSGAHPRPRTEKATAS